jgi:hypothetical protein
VLAVELLRMLEQTFRDSRVVETESLCIVSGERVSAPTLLLLLLLLLLLEPRQRGRERQAALFLTLQCRYGASVSTCMC